MKDRRTVLFASNKWIAAILNHAGPPLMGAMPDSNYPPRPTVGHNRTRPQKWVH